MNEKVKSGIFSWGWVSKKISSINIGSISHKVLNALTFKNLPIRRKFIMFTIGSLFWFSLIFVINFITNFDIDAKSKTLVQMVGPHQEVGNIAIRKIRGANISVINIALYHDKEAVKSNFLQAGQRLEDSSSYLKILLTGGIIKDYSQVTGQVLKVFHVKPLLKSESRIQIEEAISNIKTLDRLLKDIYDNKMKRNTADSTTLDRLHEYDNLSQNVITGLNNYVSNLTKEWEGFSNDIDGRFKFIIIVSSSIFVVGTTLSVIFGILISHNLERPIRSMIAKFQAMLAGRPDYSMRLDMVVTTGDELRELLYEFNNLVETIEVVTSFKKIIEADETAEDVLVRLGKVFNKDLGFNCCIIYNISSSQKTCNIVYPPENNLSESYCGFEIMHDFSLCRAVRTGQIVSSTQYPDICKYFRVGTKTHVCIPVILGGNIRGIVQLIFDKDSFEAEELEKKIGRVQQYISESQPVLEVKILMRTLKETAIKDELTGLYNRRFLHELSESLSLGIIRRGSGLGILMCDLDFFKEINDAYGHDIGDKVLVQTANIIRKSARGSDIVIRFGGEEFLVLLVDIKPGDSAIIAEKIREKIEQAKFNTDGTMIRKTISIGVSEFPGDTPNFWEVIKFADVALYKAKERGRNRVERFEINMWSKENY